jgi:hypothetical protein
VGSREEPCRYRRRTGCEQFPPEAVTNSAITLRSTNRDKMPRFVPTDASAVLPEGEGQADSVAGLACLPEAGQPQCASPSSAVLFDFARRSQTPNR